MNNNFPYFQALDLVLEGSSHSKKLRNDLLQVEASASLAGAVGGFGRMGRKVGSTASFKPAVVLPWL